VTPEHLVNSAKLYDYYVNGLDDGNFTHTSRVHLTNVKLPSQSSTPSVLSAPALMDLLNTDNIEPNSVDTAAMEELWFDNPDPYDLAETDRVDAALGGVIRSSTRFDIATYIKLDDPKLDTLISKVDTAGPGASLDPSLHSIPPTLDGEPGDWSIDSFL
jgi:hypothetical protein